MNQQSYNVPDDPYKQLRDRIRRRLKEEKIDDQIFSVVKEACTGILRAENIILSRTERNRLLHDLLQDLLADMLAEM